MIFLIVRQNFKIVFFLLFLFQQKLKQLLALSSSASLVLGGICIVKGDPRFYSHVVMPMAHAVVRDPEAAHKMAVWALKKGLVPKEHDQKSDPRMLEHGVDMVGFVLNFSL